MRINHNLLLKLLLHLGHKLGLFVVQPDSMVGEAPFLVKDEAEVCQNGQCEETVETPGDLNAKVRVFNVVCLEEALAIDE